MIELTGLQVSSFLHPEERAAWEAVSKAAWLRKIMDWVGTTRARLEVKTNLLGNAFGVTKEDMPQLFHMICSVCEVLDYPVIPQVYVHRSSEIDIKIYYGDAPVLIYPDFILHDYDAGMLRFYTGRAITFLKSNNAQFRAAVCAIIPLVGSVPVAGAAALPVLTNWLRKADYTEDRGGLLACQSIQDAGKALMRRCGLPTQLIDPARLPSYLKTCKASGSLTAVSQAAQTMYRTSAWNNDRITELYKWYASGAYDDLLEEFE